MTKPKVTLLIPTLNEVEGMRAIMPQIRPEWYDQILILDGGSRDGTVEYARDCGYPVHVQQRPGLRRGYFEVLPLLAGEVIITFSPDGNSLPECIPPLIAKMAAGHDMVIVSRYLADAKSEDDDLVTGFGNWLFTTLINVIYNGHYTDTMVMFRAFRRDLIARLALDREESYAFEEKLLHTDISWEPLMSIRCAKHKLNYAEIPGNEPPRLGGERKLQVVRWGCAYMYQVFRERFRP